MPGHGRYRLVPALLAAAALLLAGCSAGDRPTVASRASSGGAATPGASDAPTGPTVTTPCGWMAAPPTSWDHVIWIWMENKSYDRIIGPAGSPARQLSPYLNSLADRCGLATNFHNVTHMSLPNYLASVSGTTGGVRQTCAPTACPQTAPTIFAQLTARGRDWRSYQEGMARPCQLVSSGSYAARHNPVVYFPAIRAECDRWSVGFTDTSGPLVRDLASGDLPTFAYITPDLCHDTHNCTRPIGDAWLAQWVPRILASPAYRTGRTLLVVTYDEGSDGVLGRDCTTSMNPSCHTATIVVAPSVPAGTRSDTHFTLYSLLRTTQELLGLQPLLGAARHAPSMRAAFHL